MENYYKHNQEITSYDDSIHEIDLDELAIERSKTKSMYWELLSVLKHLSVGMDLTRIQAPIIIVKPISFLEMFSQYAQPTEEVLR